MKSCENITELILKLLSLDLFDYDPDWIYDDQRRFSYSDGKTSYDIRLEDKEYFNCIYVMNVETRSTVMVNYTDFNEDRIFLKRVKHFEKFERHLKLREFLN